jgi:hypothetical protein
MGRMRPQAGVFPDVAAGGVAARSPAIRNGHAAAECHPDKILLSPAARGEFPAYVNRRIAANIGSKR